ncbi:DUF6191 domain-containing protein [Streptomyces gobiensis]|uniref:DUF6191 domain-containing protein n=1 Tax=Streptomyces gobiensis TaxID=2875706 RepID=UPI001E3C3FDA|nr:DUF6191 domain-containing protein [Streptomyces gobiensis]UGY93763.1 DUF6191 domain-containing protein [Streptomyces gobiensis]
MFGLAEELFSPATQHTEDERQRLEHTRVEEGSFGPGCGPVDLDSGQILIAMPTEPAVLPPRPRVAESEEED